MSSIGENSNKPPKSKFPKLYKFLKETYLLSDDSPSFIQLTQIFSIPIFYQILFMFTIIKTLLIGSFFLFRINELSHLTTTLIMLEITTSFLLTQQQAIHKIKTTKLYNLLDRHFLEKILKFFYIIIFCLEQNYTIYYYDCLMFNLNPGYIFFIVLLIYYFDMKSAKKFNEFLFYFYIFNLIFFIYFSSFRNFMNFFLPTILVLSMFILMNLISQNYNKKLMKLMIYHKFFENLVQTIFKLNKNEMSVIHDGKVLYKEYDDQDAEQLLSGVSSSQLKDINKVEIEEFKGFQFKLKTSKFDHENKLNHFMNFLFYLRNTSPDICLTESGDGNLLMEEVYNESKSFFKNSKMKSLIEMFKEKSTFTMREKIIYVIIAFVIESVCNKNKISTDELINDITYDSTVNDSYYIIFKNIEKNKIILRLITDIIKEFSRGLNFSINITDYTETYTMNIEIKFNRKEKIFLP